EEDAFLNELLGALEEKETSIGSTAVPTTPAEVQAEVVGEEVVEEIPMDAGEAIKSILAAEDEVVKELGEKYSALEQVRAPQEFLEFCTFEIPPGYRELERYWITRPYVWASILYSPEKNERLY
ncbi:MAG: hypothetical protein QXG38_00850, partial [Candidatus Hadarchaeales archaeon]